MVDEKELSRLKNLARNMRKDALDMALAAGNEASHFGAGCSIIDILAVLYGKVMKYDIQNPQWEERDRFILSKGHGALGYYSALAESGFINKEELFTFEKDGSFLLGHPVKKREKGIEFTNGSLGMGLSLGIGVSLANRMKQRSNTVYVLMGDGECNEGSVWEAFMAASQYKLTNLVAIIDRNHFQLGGNTTEVMDVGDIKNKIESFGWDVREVNGHDIVQLYNAFTEPHDKEKPLAIVANTIKGKGFSFSENNNAWHHAVLTQTNYDIAIQELKC